MLIRRGGLISLILAFFLISAISATKWWPRQNQCESVVRTSIKKPDRMSGFLHWQKIYEMALSSSSSGMTPRVLKKPSVSQLQ